MNVFVKEWVPYRASVLQVRTNQLDIELSECLCISIVIKLPIK